MLIIENILLLAFLGVVYYVVVRNSNSLSVVGVNALHGVFFGLVGFLVTSTPVTLVGDATIDARAGPMVLAGLIGGPVGGIVATALGATARGLIGGDFALSGMVSYGVYALTGVLLRALGLVDVATLVRPRSIILLVVCSCLGASAMFFLITPLDLAIYWLQNDLPYIYLANTLALSFAVAVIGIANGVLKKNYQAFEANERLRLAKTAGRFGVWDFDIQTGNLVWDEESRRMHGLGPDDVTGTFEDWTRNVHPDDLAQTQDKFVSALASGKFFEAEYRINLPGGEQNVVKGDAVIMRDRHGKAIRVVGTNIDLTETRSTEAKLDEAISLAVQAQKFDTIGQLTGGVAHDFNNLLAVIMGNLELLKDEVEAPTLDRKEAQNLIDASIEATKRGADLTRNMLAYARKARLTPVVIDLNEVVRETETWIRRTIESRIAIETVLQAGLWPTLADKSSLQSALVNLLVNARDAFDGSGKITIETANIRVDEEYVGDRHEDIKPGRYVMLAVSDTGKGIPSQIIDQIFDPFFSTKDVGKGSGLGLSMVQGFMKQSGGTVRVYSELGTGSSFKLYFPVAPENQRTIKPYEPAAPLAVPTDHSRNRILLVEDREEVVIVLEKTLVGAGYEVVIARSGDEGLSVFSGDTNFELVITDIVMPGDLQGPTMAQKIRELCPTMRFIFLSGYASEATVHGNGLKPEDIRLMKPISRSVLLDAVRKSLAGPKS
jgi:signal transduction histidine kinase/CheY-like chemotaxis protein